MPQSGRRACLPLPHPTESMTTIADCRNTYCVSWPHSTAEGNLGVGAGRVIYQGFLLEVWCNQSPPGFRMSLVPTQYSATDSGGPEKGEAVLGSQSHNSWNTWDHFCPSVLCVVPTQGSSLLTLAPRAQWDLWVTGSVW